MKTNTGDSLARRPGPAAAVVVLLHLGLLGALLQTPVWPDREARNPPTPTWLRLLPLPLPAVTAPGSDPLLTATRRLAAIQTPTPTPKPTSAPAPPRRPDAPAASCHPVDTTLFVAPATLPAAPASSAAGTPAASEAPRPLNLSLPRNASPDRHPALDDPRSNTPPPTLESRLAEVMGPSDGPITQEQLPDGSLRLRRGTSCAVVRPSRTAMLDPFNLSVSPKPRQVDRC